MFQEVKLPDTLEKVTLARNWNKHEAGSTLSVDSARAEWLRQNDYLEGKSRGRVSKSKKKQGDAVDGDGE